EYAAGNINPSTGKGLISAIKTLLNRIGKYVRELFNPDFTIYAENLNPNTTLEQLGQYMAIGNSKFEGLKSAREIEREFGLRTNSGGYKAFSNVGVIKNQITAKYPTKDIFIKKDGEKSIIIVKDEPKFQKVDKNTE